jgi:hypothetical protein
VSFYPLIQSTCILAAAQCLYKNIYGKTLIGRHQYIITKGDNCSRTEERERVGSDLPQGEILAHWRNFRGVVRTKERDVAEASATIMEPATDTRSHRAATAGFRRVAEPRRARTSSHRAEIWPWEDGSRGGYRGGKGSSPPPHPPWSPSGRRG